MRTFSKPILLFSFLLFGGTGLFAQQNQYRDLSLTGKPVGLGDIQQATQAESNTLQLQTGPRISRTHHSAGLYLQPNQYFQMKAEKPKIMGRDVLAQFLGGLSGMAVGTLVGLVFGGIIGGTFDATSVSQPWFFRGGEDVGFGWGAMAGSAVGAGFGTWMAGNSDRMKGSLLWSLLGSLAGGAIGYSFAFSTEGALFLFPVIFAIGGGMLGFSLSRKSWTPPSDSGAASASKTPGVRMEFLSPPSPVNGKSNLRGFRERVGMGLFKLKF